ncbi:response regulator transcription factor [Amylibacter sp. SFDW26]|uniref:response regulator transcription factor n=1 Tax=Amylibacter sp. SFDW26 TaxID=2652722 RepID=UPI0012614A46|nr:response regulator transcription factor [Amylibacter sp. SFDW26]KAB7610154.1 response regulator transcription factor [Amylibacter sp. SFDW26]
MRILLADDHDLVRETLSAFLEKEDGFTVAQANDITQTKRSIETHEPFDLVLLDYEMPGMNGLDGLKNIMELAGRKPVAIISGTANKNIAEKALELGAAGFLPKSMAASSLVNAVKFMAMGEKYAPLDFMTSEDESSDHPLKKQLSDRELQVLSGLCRGLANKEIAREVELQEVTVKLHVKTLCRKLDAKNRTHAAMIAKDAGLF